jgi:hypothetical protein
MSAFHAAAIVLTLAGVAAAEPAGKAGRALEKARAVMSSAGEVAIPPAFAGYGAPAGLPGELSDGTCGIQPPFGVDRQKAYITEVFETVRRLSDVREPIAIVFIDRGTHNAWAATSEQADKAFGLKVFSSALVFDLSYCDWVHNEDELAGVLGHELGHFAKGHSLALGRYAQELQEEVARERFNPALDKIVQDANDRYFAKSRFHEGEADRLAVEYLSRPGSPYDPFAAARHRRHIHEYWKFFGWEASAPTHPPEDGRATMMEFWSAVYSVKPTSP